MNTLNKQIQRFFFWFQNFLSLNNFFFFHFLCEKYIVLLNMRRLQAYFHLPNWKTGSLAKWSGRPGFKDFKNGT